LSNGEELKMPQRLLEICVDSLDLALAAVRGGADRLELSGPLFDGGVTPNAGFVAAARRMIDLPLAMLVRPHAGSFTPSDAEFEMMRQDVLYARNIGIDIIVLGLLHSDQTIDTERTKQLVELARPLEVTFHRAFDVSPNLEESLASVIQTGATRVLTAGGQASAVSGAATVKGLRETADNRIGFLLCGGITAATVCSALKASNVVEVHAGLRDSARAAVSAGSFEVFTASVDALRQEIRSMDGRSSTALPIA
jgi:copper homeostasis protein